MKITGNKILGLNIIQAATVYIYLLAVPLFAAAILPTEPTVSTKEAALLSKAAAVADTNTAAAAGMLISENSDKASPAIDFTIGNLRFQAEQLPQAEKAYLAAIKKMPTFRSALKNLGKLYLQQEREEEAIRIYRKLVEQGLADADSMLLLGSALLMQSHYVAAENAFRQTLLLKTDSSEAQQGLIKCLLEQERCREARSLLKTMLKTNPSRPQLWNLLANVNMTLDENQNAIIALETAQRLQCCTPAMLMLLGDLYLNAEQPQDAVKTYTTAINAGKPDSSRLLQAAEGFIITGNAAQARKMLRAIESAADHKNTQQLNMLKADLAQLEKQPAEAEKIYRKIIAENPLNGKAMLKLGELQQNKGDIYAAELNYERAARIKSVKREALVKQAQLAAQNNRFNQAVNLLEAAQAIETKPNITRYLKQIRYLAETPTNQD